MREAEESKAGSTPRPGKERLLVFPRLAPARLAELARRYTILHLENGAGFEAQDPASFRGVRAALTTGAVGFSRAMFEACPDLEAVISFGAGIDRIDMDEAIRRGVRIANGSGANAVCVAEHAMALLLSLAREIPLLDARVRAGRWRPPGLRRQISGKRLGILGLGAIGRNVARMAEGFGMEIAYTTRRPRSELPYRYFPQARELAFFADALVVACPGGPATHHLVDEQVMRALGSEGFLVNIARGSIVETAALARALRGGMLAGAALDVFENEPQVPGELLDLENVILTPHVASNSQESRDAMFEQALANLTAFYAGKPLPGAVDPTSDPASC
jgi:lactate dehydrogenase-like 2-hydroxyacid dehydrogenase